MHAHTYIYIGAEIVSACQEATMLAVEDESEGLTASYLQSSIASIEPQITDNMILYYDSMIKLFS